MNSDHIGIVLIALFKSSACIAAIYAAMSINLHGNDGWGWFVLAAIILGLGSYKLD